MNLEINIFTRKGFEQKKCVREETAHLATLKSQVRDRRALKQK
jgi:hypothetical protein